MPESRLDSNKKATMENVAKYAKRILPRALNEQVDTESIKQEFDKLLDDLLEDAAGAVLDKRYSDAIDILEEAKDAVFGIRWVRLKDSAHKDRSVDLIRDATMQEHVAGNKATQEHIMKLIRAVSLLRSSEELMKTTVRGAKAVKKSQFIAADVWKGVQETEIFKCKKELISEIGKSLSTSAVGGYSFEEKSYIQSLRKAIKVESGIKNKESKMDWARKNLAIQDKQYHTTTLIKQKDKDGVPLIVSESSIMMLGFSSAQVKAYTRIHQAGGQKVVYRADKTKQDNDVLEITKHYNSMSKKQRKLLSGVAVHIQKQDKVVPSCSDGIDCIKNPRMDVVVAHQEFRAPNKLPEVKSSEIGHSYSMDGLNQELKVTTSKVNRFFNETAKESFKRFFSGTQPINSKIEQLKGFFPEGQKLNVTLLGEPKLGLGITNLFSKNRVVYNALSKYSKGDDSIAVKAVSLKPSRIFTASGFEELSNTLKKSGSVMERECKLRAKELESEIVSLRKNVKKMKKGSVEQTAANERLSVLNEKVSEISKIKEVVGCIAHNVNAIRMKNAISLAQGLTSLDGLAVTKNDLICMLEAKRLLRKIDYDKSSRNQELVAMQPMVMSAVDKIMHKEQIASGQPGVGTVNIVTSARGGRTALLSLRSAQKSIATALGFSSEDAAQRGLMAQNLQAQLAGGHMKHQSAAMGVKGVEGIDKRDVKGVLKHDDQIYDAVVDVRETGRTVEGHNKASRVFNKFLNSSKNFLGRNRGRYSLAFLFFKIVLSIVLLPVKLVIDICKDIYKTIRDWIKGEQVAPKEARHFLCSGMPVPLERAQNDLLVEIDGNVRSKQNQANLANEHGLLVTTKFAQKDSSVDEIGQYPIDKNPFAQRANSIVNANAAQRSTVKGVGTQHTEGENPFAEDIVPRQINSEIGGKVETRTKEINSFASDVIPQQSAPKREVGVQEYPEENNPFAENIVPKQHNLKKSASTTQASPQDAAKLAAASARANFAKDAKHYTDTKNPLATQNSGKTSKIKSSWGAKVEREELPKPDVRR